ncbi:Imm50 family immunity protein [Rhodanobacter sp. FW102-FHT14D06]|uniref:Imm50 family immunity protein n=2 Tax=unclassified Rhodanobacter TaxID=2621553 RepID=A0AB74V870_9GAMM
MISHSDLVESIFGYWPNFADGHIELFSFEHPGIIKLRISYIDAELAKAAKISLQFTGVHNIALSEMFDGNYLDVLSISGESPLLVELEACSGLQGTFACASAEVTAVAPNPSFEADGAAAAQLKR